LGGMAVSNHGAWNYWYYQAMVMRSGR